MPPPISDRYRLEMRLGRDGDIEEWLATDTSLERPVLIRSLGPETTAARRQQFVESVGAAAKTTHPHLVRVFAVETVEGGAYSVSEWPGGANLEDRVGAGRVVDLEEFLPNAAGLAGALAALQTTGNPHGHIDLSSVSYSVAHPAKLGSFGRPTRTDIDGDVRALAGVLESSVTGSAPGGPPPSESIDGFPRSLDLILRQGQSGGLTADELEKAFLASPTVRVPQPEPRSTSRRLLLVAGLLVVVAVGLVVLGRLFTGGGPILPVTPTQVLPDPGETVASSEATVPTQPISIDDTASFDPFGEGGENDELIPNLFDENSTTTWRTERYQEPLPVIKPGVGLRFDVEGTPGEILLIGLSPGTVFEIYWATASDPQLTGWERIMGAQAPLGSAILTLPPRSDGHWLLWLTDLPEQGDGSFFSTLSEVRFSP